MDPGVAGAKWQHSATKGKVGMVSVIDSRFSDYSLTHADCGISYNYGVPRNETDRKPTKFLLTYISRKVLGQGNKA